MELDDRITLASAEGIDLDLSLAGIGSRGSAVMIDLALQLLALLLVGLAGSAFGDVGAAYVAVWGFVILIGYPIVAEAFASGRTVGKALLRIAVVSADGTPATFLEAVIRNVVRTVDLLPGFYAVGLVSVLVTERNQRLGDLVAGTLVVHTGPAHRSDRSRRAAAGPGRPAGPVPGAHLLTADSAGWDVAAVTADEVAAVRSFLVRRSELDPQHRADLAQTLAFQLLPKVAGVPLEGGPELFLERIVAAKTAR